MTKFTVSIIIHSPPETVNAALMNVENLSSKYSSPLSQKKTYQGFKIGTGDIQETC